MMLKKILTLTVIVGFATLTQAQDKKFKFGVHVDPVISFMGSNDQTVKGAGANFGIRFGIQGDVYLGALEEGKPTYAITFGTGFMAGIGGKLQYANGGILLPNTGLQTASYVDTAGMTGGVSSTTQNMKLTAGTEVTYNVNYVPISAGFKITTAEFGESYLRAFFHLPTIDILIPVSSRGKVSAPNGAGYTDKSVRVDSTGTHYSGMYSGDSKKENISKDIFPIQIAAGVGAGVEWAPDKEGGIRLVGGLYYSAGILDITNKIRLYDPISRSYNAKDNPRTAPHMISLRVGVIF